MLGLHMISLGNWISCKTKDIIFILVSRGGIVIRYFEDMSLLSVFISLRFCALLEHSLHFSGFYALVPRTVPDKY